MYSRLIHTPDGTFHASFSPQGLSRLDFPGSTTPVSLTEAGPEVELWRDLAARALEEALAGRRPLLLPPLDLSAGSLFQQSVWRALREIPPGRTRTYQEIAYVLNRPGAARAVGQACGSNPIPVLIPCHRVVASGGRLGGFSAGLDWKTRLLQRERGGLREQCELRFDAKEDAAVSAY